MLMAQLKDDKFYNGMFFVYFNIYWIDFDDDFDDDNLDWLMLYF